MVGVCDCFVSLVEGEIELVVEVECLIVYNGEDIRCIIRLDII